MTAPTLLVVAKAPVPGEAKTRVAATVGAEAAAELAAAALLDTLATVAAVDWPVVVAMTGDLSMAIWSAEIGDALAGVRIVDQRGDGFAERLVHAHEDADTGAGVVQVGMDSPQATVRDYLDAGHAVAGGSRVIGPADDGGWWLLGLPDAAEATALTGVGMSREDTAEQTERTLGGDAVRLRTLRDMDTWDDALEIARHIPLSHLAAAVARMEAGS